MERLTFDRRARLASLMVVILLVGLNGDAFADSFYGRRIERRFRHNGHPAIQVAAWRGWKSCFSGGGCSKYRFTLHKAAAWGRKGSGKRRKIVWTKAWVTFTASSAFSYEGVKAKENHIRWNRKLGTQEAYSMRRGHFQICAGGCLNYYPQVKIWIRAWQPVVGGGTWNYKTEG